MDCGQWAGEAVITTDVSQTVGLTGGVKREKTPSRRLDLRERVALARTESHSLLQEKRKYIQRTFTHGFPQKQRSRLVKCQKRFYSDSLNNGVKSLVKQSVFLGLEIQLNADCMSRSLFSSLMETKRKNSKIILYLYYSITQRGKKQLLPRNV